MLFEPLLNHIPFSLFTSVFSHSGNIAWTKMGGWCLERGAQTVNRACRSILSRFSPPYLSFSRSKPYDRHQGYSGREASPSPERKTTPGNPQTLKQIDPSVFPQLFTQLIPIVVKDPLGFESRALAICASFGLDPATSTDVVNSIKQQFPATHNQEST